MSENLPSWMQASLFDTPQRHEEKEEVVLSVSDINKRIKTNLEEEFQMIWVQGEISNFTSHSSGHFYFSLKDEKSQISAVMFKGANARLRFKPTSGMEVLVRARISVYEPRGSYQLLCETMEPVGAGALQKAFEQLKEKLSNEGLFDSEKKRPLPLFPKRVALITSPTGAAIRDMINILNRRNRTIEILLFPCQVQGEKAAPEIKAMVELANQIGGFDVMIVGRGGGSAEDLWAFNDEKLARAMAASQIPVVSAVGHEIDFTIADFVADLRAPTPSAAAELIVKNTEDLNQTLNLRLKQLANYQSKHIQLLQQKLLQIAKRLIDPKKQVEMSAQRLDEMTSRMQRAFQQELDEKRSRVELLLEKLGTPESILREKEQEVKLFDFRLRSAVQHVLRESTNHFHHLTSLLDSLSPLKVLDRGYAITKKQNIIIKSIKQVKKDDEITILVADGQIQATVIASKKK